MKSRIILTVFIATVVIVGYCAATQPVFQAFQQQQIVSVPIVQQYVTVPVQPYYYSYNLMNGMQNTGHDNRNKNPGQPSGDSSSSYLTKEEFLLAMRQMVQELRQTESLTQNNPGINPNAISTLRSHCASCHSTGNSSGKWPSGEPVVFFDGQKLRAEIDWNRIAVVVISGKMPKDGQKLSIDQINPIIDTAKDYSNPAAYQHQQPQANEAELVPKPPTTKLIPSPLPQQEPKKPDTSY